MCLRLALPTIPGRRDCRLSARGTPVGPEQFRDAVAHPEPHIDSSGPPAVPVSVNAQAAVFDDSSARTLLPTGF